MRSETIRSGRAATTRSSRRACAPRGRCCGSRDEHPRAAPQTASARHNLRTAAPTDALYTFEASADYDPGPGLEKIKAPLFAINSADDLVNPPEIGLLEKEISRVPKGRAIMIPLRSEE